MCRKFAATLVAKLSVPDGKKSTKIFDTEVAGLGVRKMVTGIASFIFEKRPKGAKSPNGSKSCVGDDIFRNQRNLDF